MSAAIGIGFDNDRENCPEHNLRDCLTCTRIDGECDYGACTDVATNVHVTKHERRPFCARHYVRELVRFDGRVLGHGGAS